MDWNGLKALIMLCYILLCAEPVQPPSEADTHHRARPPPHNKPVLPQLPGEGRTPVPPLCTPRNRWSLQVARAVQPGGSWAARRCEAPLAHRWPPAPGRQNAIVRPPHSQISIMILIPWRVEGVQVVHSHGEVRRPRKRRGNFSRSSFFATLSWIGSCVDRLQGRVQAGNGKFSFRSVGSAEVVMPALNDEAGVHQEGVAWVIV